MRNLELCAEGSCVRRLVSGAVRYTFGVRGELHLGGGSGLAGGSVSINVMARAADGFIMCCAYASFCVVKRTAAKNIETGYELMCNQKGLTHKNTQTQKECGRLVVLNVLWRNKAAFSIAQHYHRPG